MNTTIQIINTFVKYIMVFPTSYNSEQFVIMFQSFLFVITTENAGRIIFISFVCPLKPVRFGVVNIKIIRFLSSPFGKT